MRNSWFAGALSVALGTSLSAAAQQPKEESVPFSRANTVLVQTTAQPDSVLAGLGQCLKRNGFVLDTLDAERGLVTTQSQASAQTLQEQMKIRAVRVADGWKLTGLFLLAGPMNSGSTAFPAEFFGLESAPNKTAFRQVVAAAQAVPQGTLRYSRGKVRFGAFTKLDDALKMPW
ncbi:hypothetical protein LGH70_00025 [Hymenobacter sp. BT635]|uniref:DUF4252 domain-containing protein n=1 Tax=Hymenobacter nitidus TaxID=2880929 RepID=A0ABS8A6A6_9BACT|nr:hypothetical protein [Hymenobacter nitidus]MCB2375948.1 hypothetical protein [Hymenobacter nitidus]